MVATAAKLILRRASVSRNGGSWDDDDFDVFDGDQDVGRIYRVNAYEEVWFWGVSFMVIGRACYQCIRPGYSDPWRSLAPYRTS